ncbi:M56 family metallopeptidase [Schlesneria paludicola]|uniref:M56 family metallopeptidase n=1 Tax=Schlesneria paludicola TaxID=360056 RepID=UPI00029ABA05|nr:M56 family metallopeptidase [Schlesneria paludicola]
MTILDILWRSLFHASLLCGLVLSVGVVVLWFVRPPADRLRVIQWVLVGCLLAPWLPGISAWKSISLNVLNQGQLQPMTDQDQSSLNNVTTVADLSGPHEDTSTAAIRSVETSHEARPVTSMSSGPPLQSENNNEPRELSRTTTVRPGVPSNVLSQISLILILTYSCIAMAIIGGWIIGLRRRAWIEKTASAAPAELIAKFATMTATGQASIRLLVSDRVTGPMTWGLLRPVIIVPTELIQPVNETQLRWSLAHELSHVERRDVATLLLASLVQLTCYYQPFYWWLRRQMSLCQDFLADAKAADETGTAEDYAEFLVRLARERIQPSLTGSLGIADGKSRLYRRIRFLLNFDGTISSKCSRAVALFSAVVSISFFALLTTISLDAQESQPRAREITQKQPAAQANDSSSSTQADPLDSQSLQKRVENSGATAENLNKIAAFVANQSDDAKLEPGVVTGMLVRSDGSPVADATVILHAGGSNKTKSNGEGLFRLENIRAREYPYPVWAHQGNLISHKVSVSALNQSDPKVAKFTPLLLEMTEGKKASFSVTSEVTNKPIAGANVRFGYPDRRLVTTDEQGIAIVEGLLPEEYQVSIEAAGHARNAPAIDLARTEAVTLFNVRMKPGGVVRGRVVDSTGSPIDGAEVIYRPVGGSYGIHGDAFVTNKDGGFQNSYMPLETPFHLSIQKKGYLDQQQEIIITSDQRTIDVQMTLSPRPTGGSVKGTITDETGNPIADAEIANYGNKSGENRITKSDSEGSFDLHDLFEGFGGDRIIVSAQGFAPQNVGVKLGTADQPGLVNVSLKPGHTIHGRILNEDGTPAKGAMVYVRSPELGIMPGFRLRTADDNGVFEFDSLPADSRFDVTLGEYRPINGVSWKLDSPQPQTVTLSTPGAIRGRVLDELTKQPVKDFRIKLGFSTMPEPSDAMGTYNFSWGEPGQTFKSVKGEFVFTPLTVGFPASLVIEADGYERKAVDRAVATKLSQPELLDIELTPTKPGKRFTLTGQFLDHTGQPVADAQLRLIASTGQPAGPHDNQFNWVLIDSGQLGQKPYCVQFLSGTTNAEGRFEFKQIQSGNYLQLAYWGAGVPKGKSLNFGKSVAGGRDDVTIDLPAPARIEGTIDRSKLADAESIDLYLNTHDFHHYRLKLKPDQKTFAFEDLPAGQYQVTVVSKAESFTENGNTFYRNPQLAVRQVRLKEGQSEQIEFLEPIKK